MKWSITGHVLKWARQSNLSLGKGDGWNLKNHNHLAVARHLREKTHSSMLVVTIREGEKRSVVVLVLNKESAMWKEASMKTLLRGDQMKYTDVEGMRLVTNNRYVAGQINSDKVENVATSGKNWRN